MFDAIKLYLLGIPTGYWMFAAYGAIVMTFFYVFRKWSWKKSVFAGVGMMALAFGLIVFIDYIAWTIATG
jgi:hypothetical protein